MLLLSLSLLLAAEPPAAVVIRGHTAPEHAILDGRGFARLLLGPDQGVKEASMAFLLLDPGAAWPAHVHEHSAELLYLLEGTLSVTLGDRTLIAHRGDAIYIPADASFSARVLSKLMPVEALQVFVGPGPERGYRQGPRLEGD